MAAGITLCGSLSKFASPLGAAMHNAAYRALGIDWHYVPFQIDALAPALVAMRTLGVRGCGISMPFKLEIMPLLDAIDPLAAKIGAVNTVVNEDGRLIGHNTDWVGAARALAESMSLDAANVLVLGAGGAARAVAFGLAHHGAKVHIANRTDDKAHALANEVGAKAVKWDERGATSFDALVNATSAGMADTDPTSPFPVERVTSTAVVMDIVYKPLHTQLLAQAGERGATTVHGGRMLLHQAARQLELYTERDAPLDVMDAALQNTIRGS
jgi:shikimate dehydrogenase